MTSTRSRSVSTGWILAALVFIHLASGSALGSQGTSASGPQVPQTSTEKPPYFVEIVDSPFAVGNTITNAIALNESGQMAGSGFESFWFEGFVWPDVQVVVELSPMFGWGYSEAAGINDSGTFVGTAAVNPTTTKPQAFVADLASGAQFLQPLVAGPNIQSVGLDITNSGLIAGYSDTVPTIGLLGNPFAHAVLWTAGVPQDLGTLGGDVSVASGVNESGVVVGVSNLQLGGLVRGFRWTSVNGMEQLVGFAAGARTWASDVNDAGLIAGDADSANGRKAVVWSALDTFRVLDDWPGDTTSEARAINTRGEVVGRGIGATIEARLWKNDEVFNLTAMVSTGELEMYGASDINDAGQILGSAFDKTTDPWRAVSVLLTPTR